MLCQIATPSLPQFWNCPRNSNSPKNRLNQHKLLANRLKTTQNQLPQISTMFFFDVLCSRTYLSQKREVSVSAMKGCGAILGYQIPPEI